MKALYKLHIDCGRMGDLNGIFISDTEKMKELVSSEKHVNFGECLGKHSEVYCPITEEDYTFITADENVIEIVEQYGLENGFNPFDYLYEEDEY